MPEQAATGSGQGSEGRAPRRPPVRALLVAVVVLSLGLAVVTRVNYRTAVRVAEETLRNRGVGLSLELAAEARSRGERDAVALQALVAEQHRHEVAFLAIMDRGGTMLAHSNPRLAGTRIEDAALRNVVETGERFAHIRTAPAARPPTDEPPRRPRGCAALGYTESPASD